MNYIKKAKVDYNSNAPIDLLINYIFSSNSFKNKQKSYISFFSLSSGGFYFSSCILSSIKAFNSNILFIFSSTTNEGMNVKKLYAPLINKKEKLWKIPYRLSISIHFSRRHDRTPFFHMCDTFKTNLVSYSE